jgi:glycosyltransferase involved in cell wall biosynthesis
MEAFGIRPHVIPPCVNQNRYRVATNRSKVVFVGLFPKKGVELAFQLAEKRPDIPFEFVESWPLTHKDFLDFKHRANTLGNVTVRRRVDDMRIIYRMAKIVLVPSVCEEAWGRVCTEAQCSGVPVLASNRGGLPESVGPGGLLVDIHAPLTEWLVALSTLWDDTDAYFRLSEAALVHSQRPEIQFNYLVDELLNLLAGHVSSCGDH